MKKANKLVTLLVAVNMIVLCAWKTCAADGHAYCVETDRPDCIYSCGEIATFTVTILDTNKLAKATSRIEARLDNFGPRILTNAVFDISATNVFSISGTLGEPGFLRLVLPQVKDSRKTPSSFSVGFEPEKIKKGSPSPKDFDDFWRKAIANLDATVPLDPQLNLLPERSTETFNFWRISFASVGGTRVYGFLSVPKDASAEKKYPVRFQVPAAGGGRATWTNNMKGAPDAICMLLTVHPYEPPFDLDELAKRFDANGSRLKEKYGMNNYAVAGIAVSREDYYFYRAILGINRAVDWLANRPDVDLTSFTYSGTSQGGGFGFYLLGLNRHFTKGALFVPAITDTMGYLAGRQSGWPRIVESQKDEDKKSAERNAPYFDGANFASRITCPVRVAVGFSDTTCPPCAVYAAYNEIPVNDKKICHGIGMTHSCRGEFYNRIGAWQKE